MIEISEFYSAFLGIGKKAISWDRLPKSILENIRLMIETKTKIEMNNREISGLTVLREFFSYFKNFLQFGINGPHTIGRLILIKKKPLEISNENNLRPIVVGSIMIKILENILLENGKKILLNSFSKF